MPTASGTARSAGRSASSERSLPRPTWCPRERPRIRSRSRRAPEECRPAGRRRRHVGPPTDARRCRRACSHERAGPSALQSERGNEMSLIGVILTLVVVGVLLWLLNNYIPMDGKIKRILNGVVVIVVVIWLLQAFGLIGSLQNIRIRCTADRAGAIRRPGPTSVLTRP